MSKRQHGDLALRPTKRTLALRTCVLWQVWRFLVINLRMTVMILKSHRTRIAQPKLAPLPGPADEREALR